MYVTCILLLHVLMCNYFCLVCVFFSQSLYIVYEDKGSVCLTLVLNKPAPFDVKIEITDRFYTATGELYIIKCKVKNRRISTC